MFRGIYLHINFGIFKNGYCLLLPLNPCEKKNVIEGHFMSSLSTLPLAIQVVYDKGEIYSFSKHGRFCQEIKLNYSPYTNYFTRVFWNRSFHVYKVNSVISFQSWQQLQLIPPPSQKNCDMLHQRVEGNHRCLPHPAVAENENKSGLAEHTEWST